jgi:hypothetical protein
VDAELSQSYLPAQVLPCLQHWIGGVLVASGKCAFFVHQCATFFWALMNHLTFVEIFVINKFELGSHACLLIITVSRQCHRICNEITFPVQQVN